jgi:hypothetical protein
MSVNLIASFIASSVSVRAAEGGGDDDAGRAVERAGGGVWMAAGPGVAVAVEDRACGGAEGAGVGVAGRRVRESDTVRERVAAGVLVPASCAAAVE